MPEKPIYIADGGLRILGRRTLMLFILVISVMLAINEHWLFSIAGIWSLYQFLFTVENKLSVYEDRIEYSASTIIGIGRKKASVFFYKDLYYIKFLRREYQHYWSLGKLILDLLFPAVGSRINFFSTSHSTLVLRWQGDPNSGEKACEMATQLIEEKFNQSDIF